MLNDPAHDARARRFELTSFLEGRTMAWGVFEDRFGRPRRRFTIDILGRWEGAAFVIDESFSYDCGSREKRIWTIVPGLNGRFSASCADCVGTASGTSTDDTVSMRYRFRLKVEGREFMVDFDDRFYLVDDGLVVNRSTMRKWGIRLGEVSLFLQRVPSTNDRASSSDRDHAHVATAA